jgi:hypothetical protein
MKRLVFALLLAGASQAATAAVFFNNLTGLSGSFTTVDLTTPAIAVGAPVTNEFAPQGISFLNAFFDPQAGFYAGPSIGNFNGNGINPNVSFLFSSGVTDVAFRFISNTGTSLFEAYLGNTLVASQSFSTTVDAAQWYGVTGGGFDRIVITPPGNNAMLATDFQIAGGAVPEPASWAMLIAGFGLVGAMARRRRITLAA